MGLSADAETLRDACDSAMNKGTSQPYPSLRQTGARLPGQTLARDNAASSLSVCHFPWAVLPKVLAEARVATATGHFDAAPNPKPRTQLPFPERVQPPWQQTRAGADLPGRAEGTGGGVSRAWHAASLSIYNWLPDCESPLSSGLPATGAQHSAPQAHTISTSRDSSSGF